MPRANEPRSRENERQRQKQMEREREREKEERQSVYALFICSLSANRDASVGVNQWSRVQFADTRARTYLYLTSTHARIFIARRVRLRRMHRRFYKFAGGGEGGRKGQGVAAGGFCTAIIGSTLMHADVTG